MGVKTPVRVDVPAERWDFTALHRVLPVTGLTVQILKKLTKKMNQPMTVTSQMFLHKF